MVFRRTVRPSDRRTDAANKNGQILSRNGLVASKNSLNQVDEILRSPQELGQQPPLYRHMNIRCNQVATQDSLDNISAQRGGQNRARISTYKFWLGKKESRMRNSFCQRFVLISFVTIGK